jgi:histidinol-phosphate aminotransferase
MLRRTFVKAVGSGTLAVIGGRILDGGRVVGPWTRGFEEALAAAETPLPLLLHNNENPLGPGEKALNAIREKLVERGVPAARYTSLAPDLAAMIAARYKCKEENVLVGCGSTQILRTATLLFTSPERPLVAGSPAYEECGDVAKLAGAPIKTVAGTSTLHHDLDGMAAAAKGAGLIYFDNPSNPAATLHPANAVATFVERVTREAGDTHIIIDEAYHDYVTDPAHHTQIPLAIDHPRVIVARTFSKAFGMAGLRVGYAIARAETIKKMRAIHYGLGTNVLGLAAAMASFPDETRLDREARRNTEARAFTINWFKNAGFTPTDSQCNFIFVNIGRTAKEFREGCARANVRVGRDFPPFEKTHARVSIGTLEEMKQAVQVFGKVLGVKGSLGQPSNSPFHILPKRSGSDFRAKDISFSISRDSLGAARQ